MKSRVRCIVSSLRATSRHKLPVRLRLALLGTFVLLITACSKESAIKNLEAKFPIEIESCVCRQLAFEADSYSRIEYDEMVQQCNATIRGGHPSLPTDIKSEPTIESLRCSEVAKDWQEVVEEDLAQQASNRKNYQELMRPQQNQTDP